MKKAAVIFMLFAFGFFYTGCKEDENDNPDPGPQPTTYSVYYSLSVFGGFDNLEVSYFDANNVKKTKSNPKTPWEENLSNFVKIDSVALRASFQPDPNKTITYEYQVRISKGSEYINGNSFSFSFNTGENPPPVYINWAAIIE